MARTVLNNGDSGLDVRTALNEMTGELYAIELKTEWFEEIASGTSGTLSAPTGGTILLNEWADGVDALTSEMDAAENLPSYITPVESDGTPITATLTAGGAWTLSGTPVSYPVAIIYVYKVLAWQFDETKSLVTPDVVGKLAQVGGTATALSEAESTQDLTAGATATGTIYYVGQGLTFLCNSTETVVELGTWPESDLESLTLQMIGACASIDWSQTAMQAMDGIGDMPASITTGPVQFEIWRMTDGSTGSNYSIRQTVSE